MAGFFPVMFKEYWSAGVDASISTARLGFANSLAGILVALAAPLLGAVADRTSAKKRFLFATFALAKEGLDLPILERLYLTIPQTDYAVVTQSIGRIARTSDGKETPIAYDYIDDMRYAERAFKKRCTIYKKNGYTIIEP